MATANVASGGQAVVDPPDREDRVPVHTGCSVSPVRLATGRLTQAEIRPGGEAPRASA